MVPVVLVARVNYCGQLEVRTVRGGHLFGKTENVNMMEQFMVVAHLSVLKHLVDAFVQWLRMIIFFHFFRFCVDILRVRCV